MRLSWYAGPSSSPCVWRRSRSASWKLSKSRIHSSANWCDWTSVLLKTTRNGRRVLYRMLRAGREASASARALEGERRAVGEKGERDARARVEHVAHERRGRRRARRVDDVDDDGRERARERVRDDRARGRPRKDLDLAGCVEEDVAAGGRARVREEERDEGGAREGEEGTHSTSLARFSTCDRTWSNLVVNRLSAVMIPPFGPRLYLRASAERGVSEALFPREPSEEEGGRTAS